MGMAEQDSAEEADSYTLMENGLFPTDSFIFMQSTPIRKFPLTKQNRTNSGMRWPKNLEQDLA